MPLPIEERWVRYCLKIECEICGEPIFPDEDDARWTVQEHP
jgi:hypothetical protein